MLINDLNNQKKKKKKKLSLKPCYQEIIWLKHKKCRHTNDSYQLPDNYVGNNNYDRINWLENKMCRHLDDSYLPIKKVGNDIHEINNLVSLSTFIYLKNRAGNDSCHAGRVIRPINLVSHIEYTKASPRWQTATHQDPTSNDIIKNINTLNINSQNNLKTVTVKK